MKFCEISLFKSMNIDFSNFSLFKLCFLYIYIFIIIIYIYIIFFFFFFFFFLSFIFEKSEINNDLKL